MYVPKKLETLYCSDIDHITARTRPISYIRRWIRIFKLSKKMEKDIKLSRLKGTMDSREYLNQDNLNFPADNRTIKYLYRRKTLHETKRKRRRKRTLVHSQDITSHFGLQKRKKLG